MEIQLIKVSNCIDCPYSRQLDYREQRLWCDEKDGPDVEITYYNISRHPNCSLNTKQIVISADDS